MFDLDQLQSIMDRINGSAHEVFPVPVSITQIQYRDGGMWIAYTQNGMSHEMTVPIDLRGPASSQLVYDVQVALIRAIQSMTRR